MDNLPEMDIDSAELAQPEIGTQAWIDVLMLWSTRALVTTVWASALLFGVYILAFYAGAYFEGDLERWNAVLPDLFEEGEPAATTGIGIHFAAGAVILILGSIQLLPRIRQAVPKLHHWMGRIYIVASLLTAIGGFIFIAVSGTVGGPVMSFSFALYGVLMFVSAVETYRHARAGRWDQHQLWSWRLYALAIGSWLYRMEYGFWFMFAGDLGTTADFRGWFDYIMDFFFYIPNLILVEVLWRARHRDRSLRSKRIAVGSMAVATMFLLVGTYFFTTFLWAPAIVQFVAGG